MRLGSVRFVRLIFIDCLPYAAVFFDLDCHGWPYVFGRKCPERVGYLTKPRRDMDSLVA